jgi:hypothetical protein
MLYFFIVKILLNKTLFINLGDLKMSDDFDISNKTYHELVSMAYFNGKDGINFTFMPYKTPLSQSKKTKILRGIYTAIKLIEKVGHPLTKAIENMNSKFFYIGTFEELAKRFPKAIPDTYSAFYETDEDVIGIATTSNGDFINTYIDNEPLFVSIVHELGHRLHNFMRDNYNNQSILQLYKKAIRATDLCFKQQLPKIGDPFSNLREDWRTVRKNPADDYFLTDIQGTTYVYTNSKGKKLLVDKKVILMRITCPSEYGASNQYEFFAEMFTLIVLEMVKPSQQVVVNKFLDIVAKESI